MAFNRFRLRIIARVTIIALAFLGFSVVATSGQFRFTAVILILTAIGLVVELIFYAERANRQLARFLESIRYSDFTVSFTSKNLGPSFSDLGRAFNEVISEFRKNKAEKEEHFNYLQTVVQHISIGIIAFKRSGRVDMYNNAVKQLLHIHHLKTVHELNQVKPGFAEKVAGLKAGESTIIKVFIDDQLLQLLIRATEFRLRGEDYTLVSLQDIRSELEEKEIESWQNLIRVLTHEINNSITPISSLTATINEILYNPDGDGMEFNTLETEDIRNVHMALQTVLSRSKGLLGFVEVYRGLTRIPKPNFRYFLVRDAFERVQQLMKPNCTNAGIQCSCQVSPPDLMLTADPDLVDQVLINLFLNAIDATMQSEKREIRLQAYTGKNGRTVLEVEDTGEGIKPDIQDKIFMPFFTSKRDGTGIGLSLSRQIMHLHKGSISVNSRPGEGTRFTLFF